MIDPIQTPPVVPKTITIDVEAKSYSDGYDSGYDDAYEECQPTTSQPLYLGHTAQYWEKLAIAWTPLAVFLIIILIWGRRSRKKYWAHIDAVNETNKKIFANHEKMHATMQETNVLLQRLIEKLDKGK